MEVGTACDNAVTPFHFYSIPNAALTLLCHSRKQVQSPMDMTTKVKYKAAKAAVCGMAGDVAPAGGGGK